MRSSVARTGSRRVDRGKKPSRKTAGIAEPAKTTETAKTTKPTGKQALARAKKIMQSRYSWQSPYDRTLAPVGSGEDQLYSAFKECLATIKSNSQEDPTASDVHQICGEDDNKEPVWMVLVCKGPHTKEFFEAFEAVFNRWDVLRQAEEQKES